MNLQPRISVGPVEGQQLNGLGMMMLQYLEQNLAEFDYKNQQGLGLCCRVSVEMEKEIGITIDFQGARILMENGVAGRPDLYLKSSYITLSRVLSGRASPLWELLRRRIRLGAWPKRPIQSWKVLRFLKVPSELLL